VISAESNVDGLEAVRQINILTILLAPGVRLGPFELRYWFRSRSRRFEVYDMAMVNLVHDRFDSMDYIIFRMPRTKTPVRWPAQSYFTLSLENSMGPFDRFLFSHNLLKEELVKKIYSSQSGYELLARIPYLKYVWMIYKRKNAQAS
jgi:hypothetical protein